MNDNLPIPSALILVAVINHPRDLEIARLLGWYRIPLRSAPKVVAVDYLALYQTGAFGQNRWQIQFIAPVRGHELVKRIELLQDEPDHPHANQDYYKIQLGNLLELPTPIPAAGWRRITFLYTTGEYLLNAKTINDLIIHSEERQLLWQSLRERAEVHQKYAINDLPNLDLDDEVLSALLGIYQLNKEDIPNQPKLLSM